MVLCVIGGNDSVYGIILRNHINEIKTNKLNSDFSPIVHDDTQGKVSVINFFLVYWV